MIVEPNWLWGAVVLPLSLALWQAAKLACAELQKYVDRQFAQNAIERDQSRKDLQLQQDRHQVAQEQLVNLLMKDREAAQAIAVAQAASLQTLNDTIAAVGRSLDAHTAKSVEMFTQNDAVVKLLQRQGSTQTEVILLLRRLVGSLDEDELGNTGKVG